MQPQEIIEMYNKGSRPSDIARVASVRTRVVRKVLEDAGIDVGPPNIYKPSIWDLDEDKRREAIKRRAAIGARVTREAGQRKLPAPVPVQAPEPVRVRITACEEVAVTKRTWRQIVQEVADAHKVSFDDIISPRRDKRSVAARHEAAWRMRNETTMSIPQIGQRLGGRDHTTALYSIKRHEAKLSGVPIKPKKTAVRPPVSPTFWTPERLSIANGMRASGATYTKICEALSASSPEAVQNALKRHRRFVEAAQCAMGMAA
jgi:hypothetical protein